jgi:predicted transcriptional regulator
MVGKYKPEGHTIVTVPVTPELHKKLRVFCAEEGRSIKWVVTKAIEDYLMEHTL